MCAELCSPIPLCISRLKDTTDSKAATSTTLKSCRTPSADAVRNLLLRNGITPANVQSVGMGKANPVASNDTAAGRQQNRRVEMVVSGDIIGQPLTNGPTSQVEPGQNASPALQPAPYRVPDKGPGTPNQ